MVEHTFVDVELPSDPDEQDNELRITLDKMGRDNWELVSVVPAGTDEEDQRITALRLFFKRADTNRSVTIDQGVYERSGIMLPLPDEGLGAVVLYCPDSWNGTVFRLVKRHRFSDADASAIKRQTKYGSVCAAVWPKVTLDTVGVLVRDWPEQDISDSDLHKAGLSPVLMKVDE